MYFFYCIVNTGNGETATIPSNISDYNALKGFNNYDEEAIIKSSVKVEGDVSLILYHARQNLGGFLSSSKFQGILMSKLYFHTGFLNANTSCIKVRLKDLDGVVTDVGGGKDQRFPPNFKIVINFRPEKEVRKIEVVKPPAKHSLGMIFASQAEHENNHSMMEFGASENGDEKAPIPDEGSSMPPTAPRRLKANRSLEKASRSPTPTSMKSTTSQRSLRVEDLISPVVDLPPEKSSSNTSSTNSFAAPVQQPPQMLIDTSPMTEQLNSQGVLKSDVTKPATNSDALLLDLGFSSTPSTNHDNSTRENKQVLHEDKAGSGGAVDNLLDISPGIVAPPNTTLRMQELRSANTGGSNLDLFAPSGMATSSSNSNLTACAMGGLMRNSNSGPDLFGMSTETTNLGTGPCSSSSNDLLGDFGDFASSAAPQVSFKPPAPNSLLNPTPTSLPTTTADQLVDNLLSGLDLKGESAANTSKSNILGKPNYNSSFFPEPAKKGQSCVPQLPSKKVSHDTFNDLLGGFTATSQNPCEGKTIGEMRKNEDMKQMTAMEAKVFAWKDGKERNLRALICSLHKILWDGARWTPCGMHQLVSETDVKKMYKKALLAVHPDRQQGTEYEELATLLQSELNDAWGEYKKDLG